MTVSKPYAPYQLVWVAEPSQHVTLGHIDYVGQVMSMRTPDGTYMVRRVPGHPGTLVELPETALSRLAGASRFYAISYAEVIGRGQFPVDMLRYDNCTPVNFRIEDTETGPKARLLEGCEGQAFLVAKAVARGVRCDWTSARWHSFMWDLRGHSVLPIGEI